MSLQQKAVNGLSWVFIDQISIQVIQFAFGIVLARLLLPEEYGWIGMLAIFFEIADSFIVEGIDQALLRKKDPSKVDYSTIFIFNLLTAVVFCGLLFAFAGDISLFFKVPVLKPVIEILSATIIVNAVAAVPRNMLEKKMDFKSLTQISVTSYGISGIGAIAMAFMGYGVWSLVGRNILKSVISAGLLCWKSQMSLPAKFSFASLKEIMGFGYKLLLSRLINEFYNHSFYLLIGKFFSARELGLYLRAGGYRDLSSKMLNNAVQSASYPLLAGIQDDPERLGRAARKLISTTMYLTLCAMLCMAACAENFILGLIGPKWHDSVPYLQLLCFAGLYYPLHYLNLNIISVKGRSDRCLALEIITKAISIPAIAVGYFWGIKAMIVALIAAGILDAYITSVSSARMIGYTVKALVKDILPSLTVALLLGTGVYIFGELLSISPLIELLLQGALALFLGVLLSEFFQLEPYADIKKIVLEKMEKNSKLRRFILRHP